ncbi:MAG: hypothetical protein PHQ43_15620 [Dehalococcoidales bacterium]|nr:hypothetical protein [Dehalococcoidales bacterium]
MANDLVTGIRGFVIETAKSFIFDKLMRQLQDIAPEYRVIILSVGSQYGSFGLAARLQGPIEMSIESKWEPIMDGIPGGELTRIVDMASQALSKKTLQMAVTSRRIWRGTTPLSIRVPMVFAAETDAQVDVVEPIKALQQMASPGDPSNGKGFLQPPGPSAFEPWVHGDNITIQIGRFLIFSKVIIQKVENIYSSRMSQQPRGKPVFGTAVVTFETYTIVTKEVLDDAYDSIKQLSAPVSSGTFSTF